MATEHTDNEVSSQEELADLFRHPPVHWLELKIPPVLIAALFLLAMWAIDSFFPVFAVQIPFQIPLTLLLMAAAGVLGIYSIVLFVRMKTTLLPTESGRPETLVTEGPFRHTRNPMYVSLSLLLIAWAIFLSDLLCLMLIPAFVAYMTRFQIIPEERMLVEAFGEAFVEYAERTPRWL
ncbi:isoprenylcysteine carboxylmethyltransferase family protein [Balneolaceae bacterium ANBcel3]|nr:isoprenylcysteine carboxylmethyltransferase family protein [Balneolaceae bacterium ANBcel3]